MEFCSIFVCSGFNLTDAELQQFADDSDATIILVDWGFAGLSCREYSELVLCMIDKMVALSLQWLTKCNVEIETLDLYGHSLGAQTIGYIAQYLTSIDRMPRSVFGLDPAGPGFGPSMRCHGIQNGIAKYVAVYHVNPGQFGMSDFTIGDAIFLINPQCEYCQPGCRYANWPCSHSYIHTLFKRLIQNETMTAIKADDISTPCVGSDESLTIYRPMPNGVYCVDTYGDERCSIEVTIAKIYKQLLGRYIFREIVD